MILANNKDHIIASNPINLEKPQFVQFNSIQIQPQSSLIILYFFIIKDNYIIKSFC